MRSSTISTESGLRLAFDTNVLVYAEGVERIPADAGKCQLAVRLFRAVRPATLVLPRQVLAELHAVLVRRAGCSPLEASSRLRAWTDRAILIDTNAAVFEAALELASDHGVPIFDAVILAAAVEARCDLLLSEDFHDGFAWRGVVVSNPFGPAPDPRLARLLG